LRSVTFWQVFAATAARFAGRVAIEIPRADGLESCTYAALRDAAAARGAWLAAMGIGPGDRCAILADNDARWCAAYLGVLSAGAVAVPLDTNYSASQLTAILRDAAPRVLFFNERLERLARRVLHEFPRVHAVALAEAADAGEPLVSSPCGDESSVAVILYTSGTTADPKGVVLTHGNLLAERDAAFSVISVSERDSVLGVLPLFHALAQLANLLLPFAVGARVVFLETVNSTELVRALSERGITIFACVPQFFYLIHDRITADVARGGLPRRIAFRVLLSINFRLRRLGLNAGPLLFRRVHRLLGRQMRLLVTGGSKLDPKIGRDFYALGFTIVQAYGLTETSGAATLTSPDDAHVDTVGKAFPGHDVAVLPADEPDLDGEIAIRGPIVMQGYFNRPEATAAVLQDGWLRTGDLGRIDDSGRLTITGRKKEVIVLASGKNIYPDEIEAQYRQSPFIAEICVLGLTHAHEPTTERLFAVVVPNMALLRERRIANAGDLLRFEIEGQSIHLPPHKRVLGYDVWFEPLPRTTTGKLKRHEIERAVRQRRAQGEIGRPPDETHEKWGGDAHAQAAFAVISARANRAVVRPDANLELDLALDSMERVELIADLEHRFGVRVEAGRAHDILTVAQLIEAVRPGDEATADGLPEGSWPGILRDLPPATDPVLARLLRKRPLAPVLFAGILRVLRVFMPRVAVTGLQHLPSGGPCIISPNHQSYLDPFFLCSVLPPRLLRQVFLVGAAEYFETAATAWLARQLNLIPVDPDANLIPAMKAGAFGLSHGKILILFPEGERSIDGTVKRFKKGAPILARHLGVPIVPVAIRGIFELWPRNRPFNWRLLLPGARHRIAIVFGRPVRFDERMTDGEAAMALRAQVTEMWDAAGSPQQRAERGARRDSAPEQNT
jgi:long-chain acyl-CoA synthetase